MPSSLSGKIACPRCATLVAAESGYCTWCGGALQQGLPEVAGERKQATVLFADIVGSTDFIAGLDAEAAMARLRPVMAAMVRAVRRYGGTILRTLGDGVKAAFGAPHAQEAHAVLACRAALAMLEAVGDVAQAPRIRIGLHSGEVVAGTLDVGSPVAQEAVGMTVHVASRIEQLAPPNTICMSAECHALVVAYCDTVPLGRFPAKGLAEPIDLFRLIRLRPAIASAQFRDTALSPFCGRASELALLRQAFHDADAGRTSVVGIRAAAGLGKSRLCFEFNEWCRQQRIDVLEVRAVTYGHATPLQPVLELMRAFFRISLADDATTARRRIARRLTALGPAFADDVPLIAEFLGVGDPAHPLPATDPRSRHARLRDCVRRIVKLEGQRATVVLIDDLHWVDEASADFIETLVNAIAGTRMMLVANFRPGYSTAWMGRPYYREIGLRELPPADTYALVRGLLGASPALEEIRLRIVERSGGNPFFVEEIVRTLIQGGTLSGPAGDCRPGTPDATANLPASVEAVIGARIDQLPQDAKALLQIGATVGKEFPLDVLATVAGLPTEQMGDAIRHLCEAEMIQEQTGIAGRSFSFRHPLIEEVAYSMQLRTRRRHLHAAVAMAIGSFDWGRRDESAGLLAHHFEAAGNRMEAARHLQRAARWVGRTSSAEALRHWLRVRALLSDEPRSEAVDRLRALASGQILSCGWREGLSAEEARPYAEEALRYARESGDTMHEPLLLGAYGRILASSATIDDYVSLVREALALIPRDADAGRLAALYGMLSQAYHLAGLLPQALAANDHALAEAARQHGLDGDVVSGLSINQILGFDVEHWIKCLRVRILVRLGQFTAAEPWLAETLAVDPAHISHVVQFIPHAACVEMAWWRHDPTMARQEAMQVAKYADQAGAPYLRVAASHCQGLANSSAGDYAGAIRHFQEALNVARTARVGLEFEARMLAEQADSHARAGQPDLAADVARDAIAVARRRADRAAECHALIVLAACDPGDAEAPAWLQQAEALLAITGAAPFRSLLERSRGEVAGWRIPAGDRAPDDVPLAQK